MKYLAATTVVVLILLALALLQTLVPIITQRILQVLP